MSNEHLVNVDFQYIDKTGSPWVYNTVPNAMEGLEIGEVSPLVRVSNFLSTSEEYIGGLPDGVDFSVTCARDFDDSPNIQALLKSFKGLTKSFRAVVSDKSGSPIVGENLTFDAVILGWRSVFAVGEADKVAFDFKISGGVTSTPF